MHVGLVEIVVIVVIGCLAMGPEKAKEYALIAGRTLGVLKKEFNSIKNEIDTEIHEITKEFDETEGGE